MDQCSIKYHVDIVIEWAVKAGIDRPMDGTKRASVDGVPGLPLVFPGPPVQ